MKRVALKLKCRDVTVLDSHVSNISRLTPSYDATPGGTRSRNILGADRCVCIVCMQFSRVDRCVVCQA
jgi:hypothetical protein